jgi:multiple sugar transport system permease protein
MTIATARTTKSKAVGRQSETLMAWIFAAPGLILLTLFVIVPFLLAFVLSFTDQRLVPNPNLPTEFVGLQNYQRMFSDELFLKSLFNNFKFVVFVVPFQSALALALAILVNQKLQNIQVFRTIYFIPVATIMTVVAIIWTLMYSPTGVINEFLKMISGGAIAPQDWLGNPNLALPAVMVLSIWQGVGFQMLIFLAGLQAIAPELYEAAEIDGATTWRKFVNITIPQLRNTLIFVVITTTIYAFQLFDQVNVILSSGGGIRQDSIGTMVLIMVQKGFREGLVGQASAISVFFFVLVFSISMIQRVLVREERQI